jgi:carboxymethylenebutenolidase
MPEIEFPTTSGGAGTGSTPGYLAVPVSGHGRATIVLQEWWGVDDHIRSVCDRLAADGFYALTPDLYRGQTTTQPGEGEQKMMALSMDLVERDMCAAADFLVSQPGFEGPGVAAVASASAAGSHFGRQPPARPLPPPSPTTT